MKTQVIDLKHCKHENNLSRWSVDHTYCHNCGMHIFKSRIYTKQEWEKWINTPDKPPILYIIDPTTQKATLIRNNKISSIKTLHEIYGDNFIILEQSNKDSNRKVSWDNPQDSIDALSLWVTRQAKLKTYEEVK